MNGCSLCCLAMFIRLHSTFVGCICIVLRTTNSQSGCLRIRVRSEASLSRGVALNTSCHIQIVRGPLPCYAIECLGETRNCARNYCLRPSKLFLVFSSQFWSDQLVEIYTWTPASLLSQIAPSFLFTAQKSKDSIRTVIQFKGLEKICIELWPNNGKSVSCNCNCWSCE